jgi:hypothetical protein
MPLARLLLALLSACALQPTRGALLLLLLLLRARILLLLRHHQLGAQLPTPFSSCVSVRVPERCSRVASQTGWRWQLAQS